MNSKSKKVIVLYRHLLAACIMSSPHVLIAAIYVSKRDWLNWSSWEPPVLIALHFVLFSSIAVRIHQSRIEILGDRIWVYGNPSSAGLAGFCALSVGINLFVAAIYVFTKGMLFEWMAAIMLLATTVSLIYVSRGKCVEANLSEISCQPFKLLLNEKEYDLNSISLYSKLRAIETAVSLREEMK